MSEISGIINLIVWPLNSHENLGELGISTNYGPRDFRIGGLTLDQMESLKPELGKRIAIKIECQ